MQHTAVSAYPASSPSGHVFTPGFDITALLVSQNGVLLTEFNANTPITVSWESTGVYFRLFAGNNKTPVYEGTDKSAVLSQGISSDTTFTLEALSKDENQLYRSVTVIIRNPTLTPDNVNIAGDHTIRNNLVITGNAGFNNLTVSGRLENNGALKINGTFFTDSNINVSGNTAVQGPVHTNHAVISGNLQVGGDILGNSIQPPQVNAAAPNVGNASVNSLDVRGGLTALTGSVSLFNEGVVVYKGRSGASGKFTAKQDGYFQAYMEQNPHQHLSLILVSINSFYFYLFGGNLSVLGANGSQFPLPNSGMIYLPISRGMEFSYTAGTFTNNIDESTELTLMWYPVGSNGSKEDTFEMMETQATDAMPFVIQDQETIRAARLKTAAAFMENLERASCKAIDNSTKKVLIEKLLALQ